MIKVTQLKDVDTTRYPEGELLIDRDTKAGLIIGGEVKELNFDKPLTRTQINNMIKKEVNDAVEQAMNGEKEVSAE